ncbi:MAG: hypothetical protein KQ78_01564 [Candidatus Izimaplasma bacterium HR2]|nr:MAG: hypothetical protein KQ78_01564 [Candidatus Izimaplasma bacterium HR2]
MKKGILVLMMTTILLVLTGCDINGEVEYFDYTDIFEFSDIEVVDIFTNEIIEGISINRYLGSENIVLIPEEINGKSVIYVVSDFLKTDSLTYNDNVEVLVISKNVMSVGGGHFTGAPNLNAIIIDEDNEFLLSYRNGIYQKMDSGLNLLSIPLGDGTDYYLHEDTLKLDWSFNSFDIMNALYIPMGTRISEVGVAIYAGSFINIDTIFVYQVDYDYYVAFFTNYEHLPSSDLIITKIQIVDES